MALRRYIYVGFSSDELTRQVGAGVVVSTLGTPAMIDINIVAPATNADMDDFMRSRGWNLFDAAPVGSPGSNLLIPEREIQSPPTIPVEGQGLLLYTNRRFWSVEPTIVSASHPAYELQGLLGDKGIERITPNLGLATFTASGITPATTGTLTARVPAITNTNTRLRRLGLVSAATAGASAGIRGDVLRLTTGQNGRAGGFRWRCRFSIAATNATARWFVGVSASSAVFPNANPSTILNCMGFGCDSGQTNVRAIQCGAAIPANQVIVDTGVQFPSATVDTIYEVTIEAMPQIGRIGFSLRNLNTQAIFRDQLTSNIPTATQLLNWQIWTNNGTTASAVAIDLINHYLETDL